MNASLLSRWFAAAAATLLRSVMTGHRYEEFFSNVWGHYEAMDPWRRR